MSDKTALQNALLEKHENISGRVDHYLALLDSIDKKLVLLEVLKYADEKALQLISDET